MTILQKTPPANIMSKGIFLKDILYWLTSMVVDTIACYYCVPWGLRNTLILECVALKCPTVRIMFELTRALYSWHGKSLSNVLSILMSNDQVNVWKKIHNVINECHHQKNLPSRTDALILTCSQGTKQLIITLEGSSKSKCPRPLRGPGQCVMTRKTTRHWANILIT